MRSSVAARCCEHFSSFSKLISLLCAVTLCCGLVPSAAFAASEDSSLSLIPEGVEGATPIVSGAKGGSIDAVSHSVSDASSFVDGGSAAIPSEDADDTRNEQAAPASDIINETQPLEVVAQTESTISYFLAQTLESTRTVPVVSSKLPLDDAGEGSDVAGASTALGSFECSGMTFAIEAGGESVALVAVDYARLPQESIEEQTVIIPAVVTANGTDYYSVTRISDSAFSSLTKAGANPDHIGCENLLSDERSSSESNIDPAAAEAFSDPSEMVSDIEGDSEADVAVNPFEGCAGILLLGIPATVTIIEDDAFRGFDTLQYLVVSEGDSNYATYDGALYDAGLTELLFIPEGRVGAVSIAPSTSKLEPRALSQCPLANVVVADPESDLGRTLKEEVGDGQVRIVEPGTQDPSMVQIGSLVSSVVRQSYSASGMYININPNWGTISIPGYADTTGERVVSNLSSAVVWSQSHIHFIPLSGSLFVGSVSRTGYTFDGWQGDWGTLPAKWTDPFTNRSFTQNTAVVALWKANSYTVSFNANGGSGGQSADVTATYDSGMPTITTTPPFRPGYRFDGWYDTAATSGGTQYYNAAGASVRTWNKPANATLYARWVKNSFTFRLNLNGGSITYDDYDGSDVYTTNFSWYSAVFASGEVHLSDGANASGAPITKWGYISRPGYRFAGLSEVPGLGAGTVSVQQDYGSVSYSCLWTPATYAITWDAQGGSVYPTADVSSQTYAAVLKLPAEPTRRGYAFAGWWTEANGGTPVGISGGITNVEAKNATYFAQWSKVEGKVLLNAGSSGEAVGAFDQDQVDAYNAIEGRPAAVLLGEGRIELTYDAETAAFSLMDENLMPASIVGSTFNGWDPSILSFDPATTPSWNAESEAYVQASYVAQWTMNSYAITYEFVNQNGESLLGCATEDGSALLAAFNEATPASDLILPSRLIKRGYSWVGWTYGGDPVTSIPNVSEPVTIVGNFIADPYIVKVDLAGGTALDWADSYERTYDDPVVKLPSDAPRRAGYVFGGFMAYMSEEDDVPAVSVVDIAANVPVDILQASGTYRVLNLTGGDGNVYDVKVLKAVWTPRIAIDVPASLDMGILADHGSNTLRFQYGGTAYTGDTSDIRAPLTFTSYTTSDVGIVAITDDTRDAGYEARAAFAERVFGGTDNKAKVSFTVSSDPDGSDPHSFALGGTTAPGTLGFLEGLTIRKPTGSSSFETTTFYLGMDFGGLGAADLLANESGCIAKLYYTVALLGDNESAPSVLGPYDEGGVIW